MLFKMSALESSTLASKQDWGGGGGRPRFLAVVPADLEKILAEIRAQDAETQKSNTAGDKK
ncbi:MAG: hypothetical protein IOD12_18180 [Silvanigrellales bacterium]|jgi:hypothetical protein|nr:hypothetical protein [Silvanigrellales bacterium]